MKKYFVKQHDQMDCGAACVAMVLGTYGRKLQLAKVRDAIRTDINGTSVYGMIEGAKDLGLDGSALMGTLDEFCNEVSCGNIRLPAVVHVFSKSEHSHFLVVYKINKKRILVADPDKRIMRMLKKELEEMWLGTVISYTPNDKLVQEDMTATSMDKYIYVCRKQKLSFGIVAFMSLLVAGISMIGSLLFEYIIDGIYNDKFLEGKAVFEVDEAMSLDSIILSAVTSLFPTFSMVCFAIIILYVIQCFTDWLRNYVLIVMAKRINIPVMMGFFEHILKVPMSFYAGRQTGDVMSRFGDASGICQSISEIILTILIDGTLVVFYGVFLSMVSDRLFFITVASCAIYIMLIYAFRHKIRDNRAAVFNSNAVVNSYLKESVQGISTIKSFRIENIIAKKFFGKYTGLVDKGIQGNLLSSFQEALINFVTSSSVVFILWYGVHCCIEGYISVGSLMTYYIIMSSFLMPVGRLANLQPQLQAVKVAAERLNDVFDITAEKRECDEEVHIDKIQLDHLTFSYGFEEPVINNANITINRGERIAVIGKNGCGKTTLANLLIGLYDADEGEIRINDKVYSKESRKEILSKIAYVPQESFFFSDTLYNNLTYGIDTVDEEYLEEVLEKCCLKDFILSLPMGLDTRLEENGANFSAGSKQKLALARALMCKPEVMILDESISNVDKESEAKIKNMFEQTGDGMTIINISHRMGSFDKYDQVFKFSNSEIVKLKTAA